MLPEERSVGIGHEVLVHLDAEMVDLADDLLVEQLADVADGRALDVVVAEYRCLARLAGGGGHGFGLCERRRHRLFAPQVLAGFEDGDGHLGMELVWRGQRDDLDLGIGDDSAPVARGFLETELGGADRGEAGIGLAEMDEPDLLHVAEHRAHRIPCQRMALAHEAGSDKTYTCHFTLSRFIEWAFAVDGLNSRILAKMEHTVHFIWTARGGGAMVE
ncbi:protein of unknown function [Aminobacter niigataensis]|nr:protein of unknown function [Aminobacter niigataensis]